MTASTSQWNATFSTESGGFSWGCDSYPSPSSPDLLYKISRSGPGTIATMCVPPVLLTMMTIIFIEQLFFFSRQSMHWRQKVYNVWILSAFPVIGLLCVIGLFVPSAASVTSFALSFYFAICLKKFFEYVLFYFGGKEQMEEALRGVEVVPANPFPCCFVCCCHEQPMTVSRINKLQALVYQVIVVYPLVYFIQTLLIAEGISSPSRAGIAHDVLGYIGSLSNFMALYSFTIINRASREALQQYGIRLKSICVQLLVAFNTIQNVVLNILQRYGQLPCGFPYPDYNQAFLMHSYLFVCELFLISILARFAFRRSDEGCHVIMSEPRDSPATLTNIKFTESRENDDFETRVKDIKDGTKKLEQIYAVNLI